jgi:hypothetical protein
LRWTENPKNMVRSHKTAPITVREEGAIPSAATIFENKMKTIRVKSKKYGLVYERPVIYICIHSINCSQYTCNHYGLHSQNKKCKFSCPISNNICTKLKSIN